jgi:hypothetical protein
MATGVGVVIDRQSWEELERQGLIRRPALLGSLVDRNALAETVYQLALA